MRRPPTHDLVALRGLYREADQLLDGWSCDASTDCCHFGRTGREPQLWPNEFALLEKAIAARGTARKSLPIFEERRCPLLGTDDRCTVYEARPFGCRTYFCDRGVGPTRRPRAALIDVGRRIAALAQAEDVTCDGPRALTRLLDGRGSRR